VVVMPIGGSKASNIILVLYREPRSRKTWFLAGSILPNEELVNVAVRELFEENGLSLTVDCRARACTRAGGAERGVPL
jgi:8-oxo-dGTP pyrophosphatase MutT (NUDIX family)